MATSGPDVPALGVRLPSPLSELRDDRVEPHGVRLYLKRDDLIHPDVPGNKWRKLKHNLMAARDQGHTRLLTFGGAYSNHLRAVAAVGHRAGFETVRVIRGEVHEPLNESLVYAVSQGMRLTYVARSTYRRKADPDVLSALVDEFGPCYVVPEGGSNARGVLGCAELPAQIEIGFDVISCACGTGGTLAGIAAGLKESAQRAVGFAVLKGGQFLDEVRRLQREAFDLTTANWSIDYDFHFGGYAKRTAKLDELPTSGRSTARHWTGCTKRRCGHATAGPANCGRAGHRTTRGVAGTRTPRSGPRPPPLRPPPRPGGRRPALPARE